MPDVNPFLAFCTGLFLILNALLTLHIKRNSIKDNINREAEEAADRLIELQRNEREVILRELAFVSKEHGRLEAENAEYREKLEILVDAVYNGTRDYRQSVTRAIDWKGHDDKSNLV